MNIRAIKGGLITLLGNYHHYDDNGTTLCWKWHDGCDLILWCETSLAGTVVVRFKSPMDGTEECVKSWMAMSPENKPVGGFEYVNWQSPESKSQETWAQVIFEKGGNWTTNMVRAGMTTMTGKHAEAQPNGYKWRDMVHNQLATVAWLTLKPEHEICLRIHPDRFDLLNVATAWVELHSKHDDTNP